jgi:hypothetical protein
MHEKAQILKRTCHASAGDRIRRQAEEIVFPEADATLVGAVHSGDAIEHGGFARSIGTDYREDLFLFHLKVHPGQGMDAAEADRQTVNF